MDLTNWITGEIARDEGKKVLIIFGKCLILGVLVQNNHDAANFAFCIGLLFSGGNSE